MSEWKHPMPPFNRDFYVQLRSRRNEFVKKDEFFVDLETRGKAWLVKKGQSTRIICHEGPQITDLCLWNANNYQEHFWNEYTLTRETMFLTTYARLWSNMPMFRPMMTIIEDTVETILTQPTSGHHYPFGAHCNPSFWYWALGKQPDHPYVTRYNCWCNLARAIKPFGMDYTYLHDNINLFQKTYFAAKGVHPVEMTDAKKGDYVEFYAEMDVLMAVSLCPSGTGTYHWSEAEKDTVSPLKIEIYDTGIEPLAYQHEIGEQGFSCCDC